MVQSARQLMAHSTRQPGPTFTAVYEQACERKGGAAALQRLLSKPTSPARLRKLPADRYLAEFTRKVFQSGFVWRVVDQKWDGFEQVFWGFDVERLLMMPDDMLERKAREPTIIRNYSKVKTVRDNAVMIDTVQRQEKKPFGAFIADWPGNDIVGLWAYLKRHGSRLGGNTGPFALRALGVDTFLLTQDVEGFLRLHEVVEGGIGSKKSLASAQMYFNRLREESGWSLTELSRLVSFSFGANRVGVVPARDGL
jgi:3-methyladenine DNA glycosylase Tag